MRVGDVIRIADGDHLIGVHPVGIVTEVLPADGCDHVMVLYLDGDYEELMPDTDYEVIYESR